MKATTTLGLAFCLGLAAGACSNPADDAPPAQVSDAPAPAAAAPDAAPASADLRTYSVSGETSTLDWVGSKVTRSHDGGFKVFSGEVTTDGTPTGTSVQVTIDTTSLWSDTEKLTGHLKSADFFDVEKYPSASFESTSIAPGADGSGSYTVTGNLDLHGVEKQVSFPATIEIREDGVDVDAEFSIQRSQWGIVYAGMADDLIREDVVIKLDVNAAAAAEPAAAGDAEAAAESEPGTEH
jgi:polyisoprenoid-binding protein YceI